MLSLLKSPKKIYSVKAPGDQILLGYDDAKLFDNPIINNLSSTEKVTMFYGAMMTHSPLKLHLYKIIVSLHQVSRFCWDMINCNVKTGTKIIGQVRNHLQTENRIFVFKWTENRPCYTVFQVT